MSTRSHDIAVIVGDKELSGWTSYQIDIGLDQPADAFTLRGPLTPERHEAVALDADVQVTIDGRPVVTGLIDDIETPADELVITGRDKVGRLVDESAPFTRFSRLTIRDLALALAKPHFDAITFANARNRLLIGGKQLRGQEPPVFNRTDDPRKVSIGASKWDALAEVLDRAELLAWSSADGRELFVGKPNMSQGARYAFRLGKSATCSDINIRRSVRDRYEEVTVFASSPVARGSNAYGVNTRRTATVRDDSGDFRRPKRMVLVEDARSIAEAKALARAAKAERDASALVVTVQAWRHGQGGQLYAPDTVADVKHPKAGFRQPMYITRVTYNGTRGDESATVQLVPLGTRLTV